MLRNDTEPHESAEPQSLFDSELMVAGLASCDATNDSSEFKPRRSHLPLGRGAFESGLQHSSSPSIAGRGMHVNEPPKVYALLHKPQFSGCPVTQTALALPS